MWYSMRNYFRRLAEGNERGGATRFVIPVLELAACVYGWAVSVTRGFYEKGILKSRQLPFPVISVGNLSWGGTGKTPMVEFLARRVSDRGAVPLILTRGYGHDEVHQLERQLPRAVMGVGKNRFLTAQAAAKKHRIGVAILDDGFQHWPLQRNLEIVTLNALNPFGNGKLIPRGILREPVSVLKKAHVVVLSYANLIDSKTLQGLKEKIRTLAPSAILVESFLEPLFFYRANRKVRVPVDRLQNQRVTTFAGIGTPRSFQVLLSRSQIKPIRNFEFPDHHAFTAEELQEIKRVSESAGMDEIVTTEKDFYRSSKLIADILNPLILATRLRITSGEEAFLEKIYQLMGAASK